MEFSLLLDYGKRFRDEMLCAQEEVSQRSDKSYQKEFKELQEILCAIRAFLIYSKEGVKGNPDNRIGELIQLHQIYNQGSHETFDLIVTGNYFKAAACLKQNIEILTRIIHIQQGTGQDGKVPNVGNEPLAMRKAYGLLNDVSHISVPKWIDEFIRAENIKDSYAVTPLPEFHESFSTESFKLVIWLEFEITREALRLFIYMYPDDENTISEVMPIYDLAKQKMISVGFFFEEGT